MRQPTCKAHCRTCGRHFASVTAFDAHRQGDHEGEGLDGRHCSLIGERDGEVFDLFATEPGVCRVSDPPNARMGEILYLPEQRAEVLARFQGERPRGASPETEISGPGWPE